MTFESLKLFQSIQTGSSTVTIFHIDTRGCFPGSKVTEVRFNTHSFV